MADLVFNAQPGQMSGVQSTLNALAPSGSLNTYIEMANEAIRRGAKGGVAAGHGRLNPQYFYTLQLLETIRLDQDQFIYFRYAEEIPIENKANKITLRRWTPLIAHVTPLIEGVPPVSDRAAAETYEIPTAQYGRFMEFSDMVDMQLVDPIVANYAKEYSIVAIETLDLLARNALALVAQPYYAGFSANSLSEITTVAKPSMDELRRIVLDMKRLLVKPRADKHFHVIAGPEFYFDLIDDPRVEKYMRYNRDTYTMYSSNALVPMFGMAFYETLAAPTSSVHYNGTGEKVVRVVGTTVVGEGAGAESILAFGNAIITNYTEKAGYIRDSRLGLETSYIPDQFEVTVSQDTSGTDGAPAAGKVILTINGTPQTALITDWTDVTGESLVTGSGVGTVYPVVTAPSTLKVAQVFVLGKDALVRTGIKGQSDAQMIVKGLGSSGVNDPLNQRQSIGFKINSVGFGNARAEAVVAYYCVPTSLNV